MNGLFLFMKDKINPSFLLIQNLLVEHSTLHAWCL